MRDPSLAVKLAGVRPPLSRVPDAEERPGLDDETREFVRNLVQELRAAGVKPHAEKDDATFLARFDRSPSVENPPSWTALVEGPEADVAPDPCFGVAEAKFPPANHLAADAVGNYVQIAGDLADMGAGRVRRLKFGDVLWGSLFPVDPADIDAFQFGKMVPPPAQILEDLRADEYAVFAHCVATLIACMARGVKVALTPFNAGGGAKLSGTKDERDPIEGVGLTWRQLCEGVPDHHKGARLPSSQGWDPWYWNWAGALDPAERVPRYERYAIQVWPTQPEVDGEVVSTYRRQCALRKSLGIAAFASGVGEWLARFHGVLGRLGRSIEDVVEFIELGNELDGLYVTPGSPGDIDSEPAFGPAPAEVRRAQWGAREAGKYMALIAAPIWRAVPEVRFRAGELLSPHMEGCSYGDDAVAETSVFEARCEWLRYAIHKGMNRALDEWEYLRANFEGSIQAVEEWRSVCTEGGFHWPPATGSDWVKPSGRDLVHSAGFHWYLCYNSKAAALSDTGTPRAAEQDWLYQDAERLRRDVRAVDAVVVRPLRGRGYRLSESIGEISFPAAWPTSPDQLVEGVTHYKGATDILQGAMLVRHLLVARALGVRHVYWFNHMLGAVSNRSWSNDYFAMGLRNDIKSPVSGTFQSQAAFARPAWYAFRRLSWLLSNSRDVTLQHVSAGLTAVRLTLSARTDRGPSGELLESRWKYAWVIWLDQYAASECHHPAAELRTEAEVHLYGGEGTAFELLSLVPAVDTDPRTAGSTDENGFRATQPSELDWYWTRGGGWAGAALLIEEAYLVPGGPVLRLRVAIASDSSIAPLCVLTSAASARFL